MVQRNNEPSAAPRVAGARVLILEAPFYAGIVDALAEGALAVIAQAGATAERMAVPGALELPQALAALVAADRIGRGAGQRKAYDGVVAIGCVIRGQTYHFELVCNSANHWLMRTAIDFGVPLGNAILTVENEEQAKVRAAGGKANKGGEAAIACLRMIEIERQLGAGA